MNRFTKWLSVTQAVAASASLGALAWFGYAPESMAATGITCAVTVVGLLLPHGSAPSA